MGAEPCVPLKLQPSICACCNFTWLMLSRWRCHQLEQPAWALPQLTCAVCNQAPAPAAASPGSCCPGGGAANFQPLRAAVATWECSALKAMAMADAKCTGAAYSFCRKPAGYQGLSGGMLSATLCRRMCCKHMLRKASPMLGSAADMQ